MLSNKLPMHPVLYVPLVFSFWLLEVGAEAKNHLGLGVAAGIVGVALYFSWALQSAFYSLKISEPAETGHAYTDRWRYILKVAASALFIIWSGLIAKGVYVSSGIQNPVIDSMRIILEPLWAIVGFGSWLTICWLAAKSLNAAEGRDVSSWPVETFLLFFYSPICAPFIFKRLRQLEPKADLRTV